METLTSNAGRARRVFEKGREYLVAPLSLVSPNVYSATNRILPKPNQYYGGK